MDNQLPPRVIEPKATKPPQEPAHRRRPARANKPASRTAPRRGASDGGSFQVSSLNRVLMAVFAGLTVVGGVAALVMAENLPAGATPVIVGAIAGRLLVIVGLPLLLGYGTYALSGRSGVANSVMTVTLFLIFLASVASRTAQRAQRNRGSMMPPPHALVQVAEAPGPLLPVA